MPVLLHCSRTIGFLLLAAPTSPPPAALQASGKPLRFSVQLPGTDTPQLLRLPRSEDEEEAVGDITMAIIANFGLDAKPQQLHLYKLGADGKRIGKALEPTQTLAEADLPTGGETVKLEVELAKSPAPPATAAEGTQCAAPFSCMRRDTF